MMFDIQIGDNVQLISGTRGRVIEQVNEFTWLLVTKKEQVIRFQEEDIEQIIYTWE